MDAPACTEVPMTARLLPLAVGLLLSLSAGAEDCVDCTPGSLCATHEASHKAAGEALKAAARDGDAGKRREAILAFGRECAAHSNCRPASYVGTLVFFLDDMNLEVVAAAAKTLGETQDPTKFGVHAGRVVSLLKKQIEGLKPAAAREREDRLKQLEAIVEGLLPAGEHVAPAVAGLLSSADLDVLEIGAVRCRRTRGARMPQVVLEAIERCRTMPASEKRDRVCQDLVVSWEELTKSGIKSPISDARDPAEMDRWITEARAWLRKYIGTWK